MLTVLVVGDVVGEAGCAFLASNLRKMKKYYNAALTLVNGENSAAGNGISRDSANGIFEAGADIITTGNHVFQRQNVHAMLEENIYLLRPYNYVDGCPGRGSVVYENGGVRVLVANLQGCTYMDSLNNPFLAADEILRLHRDIKIKIFDFHAEATSEKLALAHYLDGRASVLYGTHTHVQTNDDYIFAGGLGYLSDVGMTGPWPSVIGVDAAAAINRFIYHMPSKYETSKNPVRMDYAVFEIDESNGKTVSIVKEHLI